MNVPQNDVLHFRLLSKNGGMTGISPLSALSNELNIKNDSNKLTRAALSQGNYGTWYFENQKRRYY